MKQYELELYADYFQLYLQDEQAEGDLSDSWTNEACTRMLALAPGTVGIGTLRNVDVNVLLEIHESEPPLNQNDWDHIAECGLSVPSGKIVIAGCTDYFPDAARIPTEPGHYRVRLCSGRFETITTEWEPADDLYRVQLWPDSREEMKVIKQYITKPNQA